MGMELCLKDSVSSEFVKDTVQLEGGKSDYPPAKNGMQMTTEGGVSCVSEPQAGRRRDARVDQLVVVAASQEKGRSVLTEPLLEEPRDEGAAKNMRTEVGVKTERSTSGNGDEIGHERVGTIPCGKQSVHVVAEAIGARGTVSTTFD